MLIIRVAQGSAYQIYAFAGSPGYIDDAVGMVQDTNGPYDGGMVRSYHFHADDLFSVVAVTDAAGSRDKCSG